MAVPLHRVRFAWSSGAQLEIEATKGRGNALSALPAVPNLVFAEAECEPDDTAQAGIPALCWRENSPVLFERFQLRENTEYFIDVTLPISIDEAEGRSRQAPYWPFHSRMAAIFKADPVRRWRANSQGSVTISGTLRLRGHAGILDLSPMEGAPLVAEVVCRKIGYLNEFRALLDSVAEELAELLLQYDSPVSGAFNLADVTPETEAALLFQLRHIMAERNLPTALDDVRRSFHARLEQRRSIEDISAVEEPDVAGFVEEFDTSNVANGGPLAPLFRGHSPRSFPAVESYETTDTSENRYVKSFIEEVRLLSQRLAVGLSRSGRTASLREVDDWIHRLDEELSSGIWRPIGAFRSFPSNSQVLQKRRGYRDILRFDHSLRMSLELPWKRAESLADGLIADLRPVNELYEYWCFFLLRRTLSELAEMETTNDGSFITISHDGLRVKLLRGKRSRVGFVYRPSTPQTLHINLFYNRAFTRPRRNLTAWHGSYSARFDPDYSIEIIADIDGRRQRHWLHFDAKYRMESTELDAMFRAEQVDEEAVAADDTDYELELIKVHRQDDLFKMHTYRDGILSSRGAYILFPGDRAGLRYDDTQRNLFVRHPSAFKGSPRYLFPSVGAFDLSPGRESEQLPVIRDFLNGIFQAVQDGRHYEEEAGFLRP